MRFREGMSEEKSFDAWDVFMIEYV